MPLDAPDRGVPSPRSTRSTQLHRRAVPSGLISNTDEPHEACRPTGIQADGRISGAAASASRTTCVSRAAICPLSRRRGASPGVRVSLSDARGEAERSIQVRSDRLQGPTRILVAVSPEVLTRTERNTHASSFGPRSLPHRRRGNRLRHLGGAHGAAESPVVRRRRRAGCPSQARRIALPPRTSGAVGSHSPSRCRGAAKPDTESEIESDRALWPHRPSTQDRALLPPPQPA